MPSSIRFSAAFLTLVLAAGQRALAVNDWSVPCIQGKCSWDIPADTGSSGSVNIWGPVSAISDITPATGWQIMTKCDPNTSQQNIQLMCKDNNPDCNHLFQGNGAVNTIVRLPESCGPNPFARVAQHQVLQSNLVSRRNGSEAPVHQLTLDTDFGAVSPSQGGDVNFSVQGQNGLGNSNAVNRRSHRRLRSLARPRNHVYRQVDGNSTTGGNSTAAGVNSVQDALSIGKFNKSLSAKPAPVNFSGHTNLFTESGGSGSIDIDTNLQASVGFSVIAAGTVVPPKVTQFGLTFNLGGNADGKLSISGDITGQISSDNKTLFRTGVPGLSIPEILDIGPEFTLLGSIDANFGLKNVNAAIDVSYDLGDTTFAFPPQDGSNTDGISTSSKQVTFNADTDASATLGATAHLTPQVSIGLNAFGSKKVSASVFLNFDASLGLQGNVSTANPQPCLAGNAEINIGVGAEGSFFGLFDASTGKSLFDKNFPLFQKCFGGNSNSTNSTSSQSSAPNATATDSASQTSATGSVVTLTAATQTSAPGSVVTLTAGSASQTGATDSATTNSASQTSVTDATATPNSRRHYDAPRAVRHSARFARFALLTKPDMSSP